VRFSFKTNKLKALHEQEKDAHKYPNIVDDFFEVMDIIEDVQNSRELYAFKSLRFEKLEGKRGKAGQRSLRLNKQYRLIVILKTDQQGEYLEILDIEDYH
jgi:proteic killer suppression protein